MSYSFSHYTNQLQNLRSHCTISKLSKGSKKFSILFLTLGKNTSTKLNWPSFPKHSMFLNGIFLFSLQPSNKWFIIGLVVGSLPAKIMISLEANMQPSYVASESVTNVRTKKAGAWIKDIYTNQNMSIMNTYTWWNSQNLTICK